MSYTLTLLVAFITVETVGLGYVLALKKGYQRHERLAYGFPDFRMPLWARAYWTAIFALILLSLGEIRRSVVPLVPAFFVIAIALSLVVKGVIFLFFKRIRERWITLSWRQIAISKLVFLILAFTALALA